MSDPANFENWSDRDILIRTITNLENLDRRITDNDRRRDKEMIGMEHRLRQLERLRAMVIGALIASGLSAWNIVRVLLH